MGNTVIGLRNPLLVLMTALGTATIAVGLGLLNPFVETFRTTTAWVMLDRIRYGWFQPNETMWGALIAFIGLLQLARVRTFIVARRSPESELRRLAMAYTRLTFSLSAVLWMGIGCSWVLSNPASVVPYFVIIMGTVLSFYVAVVVSAASVQLEGEGGP